MNDFEAGLDETKTLIIPYGTIEAHGTHLPLGTDSLIIDRIVKAVSLRRKVFVAPTLYYGVCTSTADHAGTIGLTPRTLRMITKDLVRDGYAQGIRRFVLISGHGGGLHVSAMREASELLTKELPEATIASLMVYELLSKEARALAETKNDSHAGEFETSLVMYLSGELVCGRSKEEYPALPRPIIARDKKKYWPGAVWGNPEKATIEKGEKLFNLLVDEVEKLIVRIDEYKE
jgi:creatinine amidohydrolase